MFLLGLKFPITHAGWALVPHMATPSYLFCQYSSEDAILPSSPEAEAEDLKAKLIPESGVKELSLVL